jgi:putative heme degradation protein
MVFGSVEYSDEPSAAPAGDRAGAAGIVGRGEEVKRVEHNIVPDPERLPQRHYLLPTLDEAGRIFHHAGANSSVHKKEGRYTRVSFEAYDTQDEQDWRYSFRRLPN